VVRIALENAVSVASVLLTEATMTDIADPAKERTLEPEMSM
jgi:chaperonin GroEL